MTRIVVIGAGGFAREVVWLIDEINRARPDTYAFAGFVVSDLSRVGTHDSVDQILGDLSWLEHHQAEVDALALGFGNPAARLAVGTSLEQRFPHLKWPTLCHPSVHFDSSTCTFERGTIICARVTATVHVKVERFAMVNLACTLGHESVVGPGSVLNPAVNVSGGVRIGNGVLVGTGAQILQYLMVGDGATVGAGAVVTRDVEAGTTVIGVPAKARRSPTT